MKLLFFWIESKGDTMKNFIQIENNGYTIKISLQNIQYSDTGEILKEIIDGLSWNWNSFYTNDKLWYCDGSKYLNCEAVNYEEKIIIFG